MHLNVKNFGLAKALVLMIALLSSNLSFAQTGPISATIDASKTSAPISKYLYGQFLEHIGGIVNNGSGPRCWTIANSTFPLTRIR